jgi:type 1 fimbria pilin
MKKLNLSNVTAIAALLIASGTAVAGPSATLQVKGTITPAACTPTLSNAGIVDFGVTSVGEFTADSDFRLTSKAVNLTVTCTAPTKLKFALTDNRDGTVPDLDVYPSHVTALSDSALGLGETTDSKKIGAYGMAISESDVTIDGSTNIGAGLCSDLNGNWNKLGTGAFIFKNEDLAFCTIDGVTMAYEEASIDFMVNVVLSKEMKSISEIQNLDGNATLNFEYF